MELQIIEMFCITDDILKELKTQDDVQCKMSTTEIITTVLVAARFFGGNHNNARKFMLDHRYVYKMLSKSQFNRRWHRIDQFIWEKIMHTLGTKNIESNPGNEYSIDSFPIACCDNWRIYNSKLYQGEKYRGYIASKRRYFYGLRIHCLVTKNGKIVETILAPGSHNDMDIARNFNFDLPEGAIIYGDKIYNDYTHEDILEDAGIMWMPIRKKNSKRKTTLYIEYLKQFNRKMVETAFSLIKQLFPIKIHAVTAKGFELKLLLFLMAYSIRYL
jgi:hypothetical protein